MTNSDFYKITIFRMFPESPEKCFAEACNRLADKSIEIDELTKEISNLKFDLNVYREAMRK